MTKFELDCDSWIITDKLPKDIEYDFLNLWKLHPPELGKIKFMDKIIDVPRYQQAYGKNYSFSGMSHKALEIPFEFAVFLDWANTLDFNGNFNGLLVNFYRNGLDYIGSHADDENDLVKESPIISISLGQTRKFRVRCKKTKKIIKDFELAHGSYLIMGGKMQNKFTHEIVKINGKKGENTEKRINITIRQFK